MRFYYRSSQHPGVLEDLRVSSEIRLPCSQPILFLTLQDSINLVLISIGNSRFRTRSRTAPLSRTGKSVAVCSPIFMESMILVKSQNQLLFLKLTYLDTDSLLHHKFSSIHVLSETWLKVFSSLQASEFQFFILSKDIIPNFLCLTYFRNRSAFKYK